MKTAVYFCRCGSNVSDKVDEAAVAATVRDASPEACCRGNDFLCGEAGLAWFEEDLREARPDRVVIAACSVRDHEETFRRAMARAGLNPYLMQMVNIREHVAWVTADPAQATAKSCAYVRAAMARVALHQPLEAATIEASTDVLVIGAGPAGLKAALVLAEAGRRVTLVERGPTMGGQTVLCEEVFPNLECGPCMLEPVLADALNGPHAERLEVLTMAEVTGVVGYHGNFTATIHQRPRHVLPSCIGCAECIAPCPVTVPNPLDKGLGTRKAIDFVFQGALPNLPFIDPTACTRLTGQDACDACRAACFVEGAIDFADAPRDLERHVGAVLVATGAGVYDCRELPQLGHGRLPDVFDSVQFERLLASTGPTAGQPLRADGSPARRFAIVHCVGSLDEAHVPYCSGTCCQTAFKFNRLLAHRVEGAEVTHYFKALSVAGKEEFRLYAEAVASPSTRMVPYREIGQLQVSGNGDGRLHVGLSHPDGRHEDQAFDAVVLCPAIVPSAGTRAVARTLDLPTDRHGFIEELHGRMDSARSKVRGVFVAGTCQAPLDTQRAVTQGVAAAGYVLAGLVPGRMLTVDPVTAEVDATRCSGCRTCGSVCPYRAIGVDEATGRAAVTRVLCAGCGTCVAACPAGAITGHHFTGDQVCAEIAQVLS